MLLDGSQLNLDLQKCRKQNSFVEYLSFLPLRDQLAKKKKKPLLPRWNRWSICHRCGTCCRRTWHGFSPSSGWRFASTNSFDHWEKVRRRPTPRPWAWAEMQSDGSIRIALAQTAAASKPHSAAFQFLKSHVSLAFIIMDVPTRQLHPLASAHLFSASYDYALRIMGFKNILFLRRLTSCSARRGLYVVKQRSLMSDVHFFCFCLCVYIKSVHASMYLIHPVAHTSIGRVLLVVSASGADTTIQTADAQLHRRRTVASRSTQTLNMLLFAPILRKRVERRKKRNKTNNKIEDVRWTRVK